MSEQKQPDDLEIYETIDDSIIYYLIKSNENITHYALKADKETFEKTMSNSIHSRETLSEHLWVDEVTRRVFTSLVINEINIVIVRLCLVFVCTFVY